MKTLKRNQTRFWYCLLLSDRVPGDTAVSGNAVSGLSTVGDEEENTNYIYDEYGNETGERIFRYGDPVLMRANISPASGAVQKEQFGELENYDKVIVTDDMKCPITESTVLFLDKEPEYTEAQTHRVIESDTVLGDDEVLEESYRVPKYDYVVRRVAKSINSISITVHKVKVS